MGSLDFFVATLRQDGVEAGKEAAAQIRSEAEARAASIVREAEARAQRIVADAESDRERILIRTQASLSLAARDAMIRLRQALGDALTRVLVREVSRELDSPEFLAELIRDVVRQYARSEANRERAFSVKVSESMHRRLTQWGFGALTDKEGKTGISVELHAALEGSGFEYRSLDETVEVTPESIVSVLADLIGPQLHQLVSTELGGLTASDQESSNDVVHATASQ